jgi:hypothetical protein
MVATEPADFHQPQAQSIYGGFLATGRLEDLTLRKLDIPQTRRPANPTLRKADAPDAPKPDVPQPNALRAHRTQYIQIVWPDPENTAN